MRIEPLDNLTKSGLRSGIALISVTGLCNKDLNIKAQTKAIQERIKKYEKNLRAHKNLGKLKLIDELSTVAYFFNQRTIIYLLACQLIEETRATFSSFYFIINY